MTVALNKEIARLLLTLAHYRFETYRESDFCALFGWPTYVICLLFVNCRCACAAAKRNRESPPPSARYRDHKGRTHISRTWRNKEVSRGETAASRWLWHTKKNNTHDAIAESSTQIFTAGPRFGDDSVPRMALVFERRSIMVLFPAKAYRGHGRCIR